MPTGAQTVSPELVRRAAFHAIIRPHLVVGAEVVEGIDVPVEAAFVEIGVAELRPAPSRERTPSMHWHSTELEYDLDINSHARAGVCSKTNYSLFGEAAVCSAAWELLLVVMEPRWFDIGGRTPTRRHEL